MLTTIRGVSGDLRWVYHSAGSLGAWTMTKTEAGQWSLTAAIVSVDTFRASQRPLTFVATHATGVWRWPVVSLEMTGGTLTAVLGPKER